jgi:hypothetical protein
LQHLVEKIHILAGGLVGVLSTACFKAVACGRVKLSDFAILLPGCVQNGRISLLGKTFMVYVNYPKMRKRPGGNL